MPMTTLKITMTLRAPFLTQSSAPMDFGLDVVLARDHNQRFYMPGTLIIGKLREAWQELASLPVKDFKPEIEAWLGKKSDPDQLDDAPEETVLPQRKRLYVEDLVLSETDEQQQHNNSPNFRIRMDAERGAVDKGAYIVTERPFVAGEKVTFQGTARFLAKDKSDTDKLIKHLRIGLQWLTQLGANRTIGFGQVVEITVEDVTIPIREPQKLSPNPAQTTYDLCIIPQTPFCVAERRIAGNLFQSSEIIPGNVLKGTIANLWITLMGDKTEKVTEHLDTSRSHLGKHFDKLRFTHAFPSTQKKTAGDIAPFFGKGR
ncbi:conserved hypothetical protein [Beggiatoa sp. PS]|nr:conserved hypothetical protein [Beggiatoa sp. PS]